MNLVCEQCRKGSRTLTLAADGRRLCHPCRERQQRALTKLAASVARGRAIAVDLTLIHEADRRGAARRIVRAAKTTPPGTAAILTALAEALRSNGQVATVDLTSTDTATVRGVGSALEAEIDHEVANTGPYKDLFILLFTAWHEWQRHHAQ